MKAKQSKNPDFIDLSDKDTEKYEEFQYYTETENKFLHNKETIIIEHLEENFQVVLKYYNIGGFITHLRKSQVNIGAYFTNSNGEQPSLDSIIGLQQGILNIAKNSNSSSETVFLIIGFYEAYL